MFTTSAVKPYLRRRETALLFNKNDSSIANERRIALVVAHEMVHMVSDTGRLVVGLSKLNTSRFADSFSCSSVSTKLQILSLEGQGDDLGP